MHNDHTSPDIMLTIEQVSQLTGVRKSTLRYWEKSFEEFLKPARTQSNRREYTMADLDLIKTIKRLLEEEHLTSEGVRLKLLNMFPSAMDTGKKDLIRIRDKQQGNPGPPGTIPFQVPKH